MRSLLFVAMMITTPAMATWYPTYTATNCQLDSGHFPFAVSSLRRAGDHAAYINGRLMKGYSVQCSEYGVPGKTWCAVFQPRERISNNSFICNLKD